MYCDESILNLELGNGYIIEKCYLNDFPFKSEIENGKNQLNIEYMGSRLYDEKGIYFICLKKENCSVVKRVDTFLNTIFRKDRITPGFPCRTPLFHLVYNHQAKSEGV